MMPPYISSSFLDEFVVSAVAEDVGSGDRSSEACIPEPATAHASVLIKEDGVVAGITLAQEIFKRLDPNLKVERLATDGDNVRAGDVVLKLFGNARVLLMGERLVLNCMQRMSGIATRTRMLADLIKDTNAQLLDTRKTTPNFRKLEKWAVLIGGGRNHRMGLYDAIMLKDNHIQVAGGIEQAIVKTNNYLRVRNERLPIEIETRTLDEVKEAVRTGNVDVIMLDNMDVNQLKEAVKVIDGKFKTEASGGVTENTIRAIALAGVDYISVGMLTHTVKSLDISMKIVD